MTFDRRSSRAAGAWTVDRADLLRNGEIFVVRDRNNRARVMRLNQTSGPAAWTLRAHRSISRRRIIPPMLRSVPRSGYFQKFIACFQEIAATVLFLTASTRVLSISI